MYKPAADVKTFQWISIIVSCVILNSNFLLIQAIFTENSLRSEHQSIWRGWQKKRWLLEGWWWPSARARLGPVACYLCNQCSYIRKAYMGSVPSPLSCCVKQVLRNGSQKNKRANKLLQNSKTFKNELRKTNF